MKVQILLLSCLAVVSAAHFRNGVFFSNKHHNGDAANTVIKGAYSTPLDHFSPTNNLSLRLKYEVNVEMFKEGGPLFLYTEFDSKNYWNMNHFGLMYELARKLNGALINAHFRYTGDNFFGYELLPLFTAMQNVPPQALPLCIFFSAIPICREN